MIGKLNDIVSEANNWNKKVLDYINKGAKSGETAQELIEEGHELQCSTQFVSILKLESKIVLIYYTLTILLLTTHFFLPIAYLFGDSYS